MNLQFFAEGEGQDDQKTQKPDDQTKKEDGQQKENPKNQTEIDYEKLMKLVEGKQKASEESVLKGYFKQQGLSKEELDSAIADYKAKKAESEPNVDEIQKQNTELLEELNSTRVQNAATLETFKMGIKEESVPYLLKLLDLSDAIDDDGKVNQDAVKKSIEDVVKAVPGFASTKEEDSTGIKIGGPGNGSESQQGAETKKAVTGKRWNRFR